MGMIKCPECGREISDKAAACPGCGCPVKIIKKENPCPNCGNELPQNSTVCVKCGTQLVSVNGVNMNTANNVQSSTQKKQGGGVAIASLLCGVAGLCLSFTGIGTLLSITGIILAIIAFCTKSSKTGIAIAGLIISFIAVFFCLGFVVYKYRWQIEKDEVRESIVESEIKSIYANPSSYIDKDIAVTIQVLAEPEYGTDDCVYIQGCRSIENDLYVDYTKVKYGDKEFACNKGDYIQIFGKVYGYIEPGEGMDYGALGIVADSVEVIPQESKKTDDKEIVTIEPYEIYNGNGVSIELSKFEQSGGQTSVSFLLTSTTDKDYSISAHTYSVNGLMAGGNVYNSNVDLPAGKKAKFSIEIDNQWLNKNGVEEISKLDFLFWAYGDSFKEWDTGNIEIKTNLYDENLMYSTTGEEIYSDQNVTIWYTGSVENDYTFVLKNKNSYNSEYTIENCSVNDWSYDLTNFTYDLYDKPIHSNSYDVFTLSVDREFMKENEISIIANIEFNVLLGSETTEKIKINK